MSVKLKQVALAAKERNGVVIATTQQSRVLNLDRLHKSRPPLFSDIFKGPVASFK